jgi:type II secretory pathway pseudopilin PulG
MALGWNEMGEMTRLNDDHRGERGFSLLEAMMAMMVLMVGMMALAQVLYMGLNIAATSTPTLIAREKAREAVESVHTARDTHTILWAEIRNVGAPANCPAGTTATGGGVFENGDLAMLAPGDDGLVNTGDDDGLEANPGPDGLIGTDDDVPFDGFTRQVDICDVNGNPDLRQITVTIRYAGSNAVGASRRTYRLSTLISRFS